MQLPVKQQEAIREVHVQIGVGEITQELIDRMSRVVRKARGNAVLRLNVCDRQEQVSVNLFSKRHKVRLTQELVDFFEDSNMKYTIL